MTRLRVSRALVLLLTLWLGHVSLSLAIGSPRCSRGDLRETVFGLETARLAVLVATAAAAVILILALGFSIRRRRMASESGLDPRGARHLLFTVAALLCGLALLYLAWATALTSAGHTCA